MSTKYKIGIVGYGNLGKGIVQAIAQCEDMQLECIFTRRVGAVDAPSPSVEILPLDKAEDMQGRLDAVILCGGSATDLIDQGPYFAQYFNTVDSFDTHARIPEYYAEMQKVAKKAEHMSLISIGWDPGLFSLARVLGEAVLPQGESYTFWGPGVSQGHSDALRRIEGVEDAKQYTMPIDEAVASVKNGDMPTLSAAQKHRRICYVVAKQGAALEEITKQIKTMPNYFAGYDTTVNFVSAEELKREHAGMAHGGFMLRSGKTNDNSSQIISYELKLESNPAFTSSVILAYTRACIRLAGEGRTGAGTVLDVPPAMLSAKSAEELRRELV